MFEKNKNAKELGIDITRKFRVIKKSECSPEIGDILELIEDDGSDEPYFWNLTSDRDGCCAEWSQLEYADEPTQIRIKDDGKSSSGIKWEDKQFNKPKKTIMNTIKNAFKSKDYKAMEHFGLGTAKDLNEAGREEFIDFVYETGITDKKEFLKKIVEAYKEEKK